MGSTIATNNPVAITAFLACRVCDYKLSCCLGHINYSTLNNIAKLANSRLALKQILTSYSMV